MRRLFVCGDIHGCYDELMQELNKVLFNFDKDLLVAVGDLCDRGPNSSEVIRLLDKSWFQSVRGNHEQMLIDGFKLGMTRDHIMNGGGWFYNLPSKEQSGLYNRCLQLPIALEVVTPSKRRIGVVHASVPGGDWKQFMSYLETPQWQDAAMWDRGPWHQAAKLAKPLEPIKNIDHVYAGHTPWKEVVTSGNMTWLDTGCFATKKLTLLEVM